MTATATQLGPAEVNGRLAAALGYAGRGWRVFPLHSIAAGVCTCGRPDCSSPGKHPRAEHGCLDAVTDTETIRRWWRQWSDANIGIAMGSRSGLFALDIDAAHEGDKALEALEAEHGALPQTITARTGGGGRHFYFRWPDKGAKNSAGRIGHGIDVRGVGGYIVAPPSNHISGGAYVWETAPADTVLADAPAWLLDRSCETQSPTPAPPLPEHIPAGRRNDTLTSLAGTMRRRGASPEAVLAALREENKRCNPPLDEAEIQRIAESVSRYAPKQEVSQTHCTDVGNSERFLALHGEDVRFVPAHGTWLTWDMRRWVADDLLGLEGRAKEVARSIYSEAAREPDDLRRKELGRWARRSESQQRVRAMLDLSRCEVAMRPRDLDTDPWLLNVRNGTIDLRTGKLRPHQRSDFITKICPCEYHPEARSDLWDRFLSETVDGDAEVLAFLQRAIGYSLTGSTAEEVLFFVHGPAATGKSTCVEAVKATMGDYARTADFETFLARRQVGGPRNDIAQLAGHRFVDSIEVDQGKRLAEGLVKMLVGGDTVSARYLYQESFEFRPCFKLWLAANHAPRVHDSGEAIWRRIIRLPFEHIVPLEKRDPEVKATLTNPEKSGSAILAWAIAGCLVWQRDGLSVPAKIVRATADYRLQEDRLGMFFADCCVFGKDESVTKPKLLESHKAWAEANHERPLSSRAIYERLREEMQCVEGNQRVGGEKVRAWTGIGLRREGVEAKSESPETLDRRVVAGLEEAAPF